ncbi:50S ribosomal protein L31 [Candidatus Roizmanbacteria bacterium]|nr:50S ribosomal protein L31 [Candidatus Roizmanbacteria bacterium]
MKTKIHPSYFPEARVTCSCGNTFITGSTKQSITVEVCHKCHPFYTGEHRFLDTKGRVDTFQKKQETAKKYKETQASKKKKKTQKEEREGKSLKELLREAA